MRPDYSALVDAKSSIGTLIKVFRLLCWLETRTICSLDMSFSVSMSTLAGRCISSDTLSWLLEFSALKHAKHKILINASHDRIFEDPELSCTFGIWTYWASLSSRFV